MQHVSASLQEKLKGRKMRKGKPRREDLCHSVYPFSNLYYCATNVLESPFPNPIPMLLFLLLHLIHSIIETAEYSQEGSEAGHWTELSQEVSPLTQRWGVDKIKQENKTADNTTGVDFAYSKAGEQQPNFATEAILSHGSTPFLTP
jgi:hypothetical protein